MEPVLPFDLQLPSTRGGLRQALHAQLREAILDGRLAAGTPLPATRTLAQAQGIARNTVVAAYDQLMAEGYVLARPGACAMVAAMQARPSGRQRALAASSPPRHAGDERLNPLWRQPFAPFVPQHLPPRSFRLGIPEHLHFPHEVWRRLWASNLRDWARRGGFSYAPGAGIAALREAIAGHVAFARAVACTADSILVTSGAQQAFDLLARALVTPGQTRVAVEEPGYPPLRATFAAAGARLVHVPVDGEGLCVDRLPSDVRVIAVTPSHQSPMGAALSMPRRLALLDFARRHQAVVIEDDYDGEFRFSGRPLDALQTLDRDDSVFYVGTFSKSLFPALRKGFIVAPAWARNALLAVKDCADAHSDAISQTVLAAFIREGHMARYVRHMRPIYARRREALLAGLQGPALRRWFEPLPCEAGLHLAARIRDPGAAERVIAAVRRHTPGAQPVSDYANAPKACVPAVSFGYGCIDAQDISAALRSLGRALA